MMRDYMLGFHMLLIGNQGVGKNKIVDKFLQTLQLPRQYIQLHRDTTVSSLTLSPNVVNGSLVWEDSPMIKAVVNGHVLVVDEIDKAPVEVVQILKGLLEDKEMTLGDGRRIGVEIKIHPQFRVIALANRPGFPFLGNDFFKSCGDMLSCHAITNPDTESQLSLLSRYGPNVPKHALTVLNSAFGEIANLVEQGVLTYPYSLRELANVVRHMNEFPEDGMATALLNVFHFDEFDETARETILQVFRNVGIPLTGGYETTFAKKLKNHSAQEKKYHRSAPIGTFSFQSSNLPPVQIERKSITPDETQNILGLSSESVSLKAREGITDSLTFSEVLCTVQVDGDVIEHICALAAGSIVVFLKSGKVVVCTFDTAYQASSLEVRTYTRVNPAKRIRQVIATGSKNTLAILCDDNSLTFLNAVTLSGQTFGPANVPRAAVITALRSHDNSNSVLLWGATCGTMSFFSPEHKECLTMSGLPWGQSRSVSYLEKEDGVGIVCLPKDKKGEAYYIALQEGLQVPAIALSQLPDKIQENAILMLSDTNAVFGQTLDGTLLDTNEPLQVSGPSNSLFALTHAGDAPPKQPLHMASFKGSKNQLCLTSTFAEISDLASDSYRRVNFTDEIVVRDGAWTWFPDDVLAVITSQGKKFTILDANAASVEQRYTKWKALYSNAPAKELEMTYNIPSKESSMNIKHGKEDPDNTPHVGGNTWAGGTGGTDTAGLGGRVGPYRLDKGHKIHQVPQHLKDSVPQHIKEEAKRVGREALSKRLGEINMTESEDAMYSKAYDNVKSEIQILRSLLQALKSKQGERVWVRNQVEGVLDDSKIVDGITGEKGIFKRRAESPDPGFNKLKKKRMMFVMDCSASMYRFNSFDGRLDREVETAIMLMEALSGSLDTISYSIVAHSGNEAGIVLVDFDQPPKNKKERLQVCLKMIAHSQYCWSGDHTVDAMKHAVKTITSVDADSYSVFVISDANLEQYGIRPSTLARIIKSDDRVDMYCIFIASLGPQAKQIQQSLPVGHGFVCLTAKDIPQILKRIFISHDHLMGGV
jgi:hypothetical protein